MARYGMQALSPTFHRLCATNTAVPIPISNRLGQRLLFTVFPPSSCKILLYHFPPLPFVAERRVQSSTQLHKIRPSLVLFPFPSALVACSEFSFVCFWLFVANLPCRVSPKHLRFVHCKASGSPTIPLPFFLLCVSGKLGLSLSSLKEEENVHPSIC